MPRGFRGSATVNFYGKIWGFRGSAMVGFGWWGCAKLWYNVRNEVVAQLQDQPVLPSDQPHCQPRVLPE